MNQPETTNVMGQLKRHLQNLAEMGITELQTVPRPSAGSPKQAQTLQEIRADIGDCRRCRLCEKRTNIVFGVGNPQAELLFVGEGPGRDEDLKAEPFVGRAGQLLTRMIEAMTLKRSDVYIANIVKCRPPDNRYPEPDEVETCYPFLLRQINAIRPKIIVTLGNLATKTLLQTSAGITTLHGRFQEWNGYRVMPTYHPAFLLRNPNMKKPCWEDLQIVMAELNLTPKS